MILDDIAPGLARDPAGYWVAPEEVTISFPAHGHEACMSFEESSFWFAHRNRVILAAVRRYPPEGGPLLDVGAGNGFVARALEHAGFPTIAIEPARTGATNAVSRHVTNVVCGGLPSAAFRRGTAGAIGLFDVIEHVDEDRVFLSSLRPYLTRGGRLYVTAPAFPWLWSGNDVRAGHHRRYTRVTLRESLAEAGFRVDFESYFFWNLPLPVFFLRTLRRDNSQARATQQHRLGSATLRRMALASLGFEAKLVARGTSIPFGGSCLAVATCAA